MMRALLVAVVLSIVPSVGVPLASAQAGGGQAGGGQAGGGQAGGGQAGGGQAGGGQAPAALPARIDARIELPGPGPQRFLSVGIDLGGGLPWSIVGCVSSSGACYRTQSIVLDDAARRELVARIQLAQARMRCPPPRAAPGDPTYRITSPSETWEGALPRDPAQIGSRLGTCAGANSLAWFLIERFGVPGLTAPQGG